MTKKAFVSGCFDLLHSGHVEFLREAATYGDLFVALGSDRTVYELKGKPPVNNEQERLFLLSSISYVRQAFISSGSGMLDFEPELRCIHPDYLVVNEDGHLPEKERLCAELGIEYVILHRAPHPGLPPRSTTLLRQHSLIPYRIDLAGGWLDQPWVSEKYPGPVLTVSIEPTLEFNERSGMATSTRRAAIELWGSRIPPEDPEKQAKILFCYDNPPGTKVISGSQDAIGIIFPGLAKATYRGEYWPVHIEHVLDGRVLQFLEDSLFLVPLGPRRPGFDVLADTRISTAGARALAEAAENCWQSLLDCDIQKFGYFFRQSYEAQVAMFPNMLTPEVSRLIERYATTARGWKLSGAGGGGYLILISSEPVKSALKVVVRRENK